MDDLPTGTLIPRDAILDQILNEYGPLPDSIPCGLENCRTPHQRGFVVAYTCDGCEGFGVIGQVCGRNLFGASWKAAKKAFTATANAAALAARVKSLAPAAEIVLPEMQVALPRLLKLRDDRKSMRIQMADFFRICADAVRSQRGYLGVYAGSEFTPVARVEGSEFYVADAPYAAALILINQLERLPAFIAREHSAREIEQHLSELGNIERRWQEIAGWMSAAERALRPDHLEPLCIFLVEHHHLDAVRVSKNRKWLCQGSVQVVRLDVA